MVPSQRNSPRRPHTTHEPFHQGQNASRLDHLRLISNPLTSWRQVPRGMEKHPPLLRRGCSLRTGTSFLDREVPALEVMSRLASVTAPTLSIGCFSRSRDCALHSGQLPRTVALIPPSTPGLVHSSCQAFMEGNAAVIALQSLFSAPHRRPPNSMLQRMVAARSLLFQTVRSSFS